jgi:hypothetical protein
MSFKTHQTTNRLQGLERTIARLTRRSEHLETLSRKYWRARRAIYLTGSLSALLSWRFAGGTTALIVALVFVALFAGVATYHNRVRDSITRHGLMLEIKNVQIARINLDWDRLPPADQSPRETDHPFETDLDLTGERSLHRLLDTAATTEGSRKLRSWLLNNEPDASITNERQLLVSELRNLSLFRDKLHFYALLVSSDSPLHDRKNYRVDRWDSRALVSWVEHTIPSNSLRPTVVLLSLLAALHITLFILAALNLVPFLWPFSFLLYIAAMIFKQGRIAAAWGEVQDLEKALRRFGAVFKYLESRGCSGLPQLQKLCAPFLDQRKRPSAELSRIERIAAALGLRTNALLWLIVHAFVPWDFFFTFRLEQLKKEISQELPRWLNVWYELEALNSLANLAWLNPHYTFPRIVSDQHLFAARRLGHPLLKPDHKVCNDFRLDDQTHVVLLTGSNMAGKSTFLRTIGLNLRLAYAGAPVNADSLELSLFKLFTCINVSDSVQDGLSYFYAEVKRLKQLLSAVEAGDELPILFMIDEIFRGTNNRERHIGSGAFIRALSRRRNAVGLIATHDLELTRLADEIPGLANFHFCEEVSDGRMIFDYLLRSGPCPTTNALKIMQIEGLPVEG